MYKKVLFISLFLLPLISKGQTVFVDSLQNIISTSKNDTLVCLAYDQLSKSIMYSNNNLAFQYAQKGLRLSKSIKYKIGIAKNTNRLATVFRLTGNYPRALELHLDALKIAEELNNDNLKASIQINLGNLFLEQEKLDQSLPYYNSAKQIAIKTKNIEYEELAYLNLGLQFAKSNTLDSARYYTQRAYDLSNKNKSNNENTILLNLGNIHKRMNLNSLADEYYRLSIPKSIAVKDYISLAITYLERAELFKTEQKIDSSLVNAKKALEIAEPLKNYQVVQKAATFLNTIYENTDNQQAYFYFKKSIAAQDSLLNQEKIQRIENLTINEAIRQSEIQAKLEEEELHRKHNLQIFGLAVFVVSFFLVVLLLTRKKTHIKLIEFLGTISLLLVFEFISLLIHPLLEKITNHTPIFMLILLVLVSSILVPLHHKLTDFIKKRLSHKIVHNH